MDLILNTNINALAHLVHNHFFYSFILCSIAIIWFVIRLNQHCTSVELLRYQYGQLAWSLSNTVIVVIACSPIIRTVFEGMIWAIVPMSTVVANDIFAYAFGKLFGRHPLTALSPKKTWEGYIGSAICTVPFGYWLAHILMSYDTLLCSTNTLQFGHFECDKHPIYMMREYQFYGMVIQVEPFQIYNLWISLWIAIVCPVGGFFASGYKRSFGMDDYGTLIPGHGGVTDRMDAEILMSGFVYFVQIMVSRQWDPITVDQVVQEISSTLTP